MTQFAGHLNNVFKIVAIALGFLLLALLRGKTAQQG